VKIICKLITSIIILSLIGVAMTNNGFSYAGEVVASLGFNYSESSNFIINSQHMIIINQTFGGTSDDYAYSAIVTSDGGYALAGFTKSYGAGGADMWLVKTNATGHVEWDKTYGGANDDVAFFIAATSDGGYVLAGLTESYGAGGADMWLVKTNATGQVEWNQTFGGAFMEHAYSVITTSDGGYAIVGITESYGAGGSDMWLVKTNATGHVEWDKTYGGVAADRGGSILVTSDGGYVLAGTTESHSAGGSDIWLVKTNTTGQVEWYQTFGGVDNEFTSSVIATSDGGYVLAGNTESHGAGGFDIWLVKTNATGQAEWNHTYGGALEERANSVITTSDGGYAIAGRTESYGAGGSDMWFVKTNTTGQAEWDQTFGGISIDSAYIVIATSDGGYVLAGNAGYKDMWLIKFVLNDYDTNTTTTRLTTTDISDTPSFELFLVLLGLVSFLLVYKWKSRKK
jgi:uncharacterized delta-60 repeat protein